MALKCGYCMGAGMYVYVKQVEVSVCRVQESLVEHHGTQCGFCMWAGMYVYV